ncbi:uncharacterized protein [Venturia canescens]|uniref:uncharacterized protein n=1 Tax=Venturia canescens TaxID=32260 RepID=UPI001C9BFC57|nr:uncharacterized protein LOC122410942 [Venturia canescens]
MNKFYCLSLTTAARIIGAFGLSTSILMINIIMSDFFSRKTDEEFLDSVEMWSLLGLNWTQFMKNIRISKRVELVLACFLGYSFLLLLVSAFLALGTVCRKPHYAVPWLYLQMFNIIDQTISLCIRLIHEPYYDSYDKSNWYIPLSSVYLVAMVSVWMTVYSARLEWYEYVGPFDSYEIFNAGQSAETSVDFNVPKTPSYVAQSRMVLNSPPPHIPIKYEVV